MLPRVLLLALAAHFFPVPSFAVERCGPGRRVTCVVDGATVWLEGEIFRFLGYDVPKREGRLCGGEAEARLGKKAADRLVSILNGGGLFMHRVGVDREGRTLARLYVSGRDVGTMLVAEGLARKAPNGRKFWCQQ